MEVSAEEPSDSVKYLDIPIQHIHDRASCARMNRRGDGAYVEALFQALRERIPGLVLRTSLITGLPGEGEERICPVVPVPETGEAGTGRGPSPFSPEEGTPAAAMEHPDAEHGPGPGRKIIEELQSRIMDQYNESLLGKDPGGPLRRIRPGGGPVLRKNLRRFPGH